VPHAPARRSASTSISTGSANVVERCVNQFKQ
jgi:hypothetical protein